MKCIKSLCFEIYFKFLKRCLDRCQRISFWVECFSMNLHTMTNSIAFWRKRLFIFRIQFTNAIKYFDRCRSSWISWLLSQLKSSVLCKKLRRTNLAPSRIQAPAKCKLRKLSVLPKFAVVNEFFLQSKNGYDIFQLFLGYCQPTYYWLKSTFNALNNVEILCHEQFRIVLFANEKQI